MIQRLTIRRRYLRFPASGRGGVESVPHEARLFGQLGMLHLPDAGQALLL